MYNCLAPHFITASPPQVSCIGSVEVTYEYVTLSTIPRVKSGINSRAIISDASNESDAFQDNHLKNNHLIIVPLPSAYTVKLRCKGFLPNINV